MPRLLSKSKYLNGLQCPKYLWMLFHQPELIPPPDAATQRLFDQGNIVGELARKRFPGGISIPDDNFGENLKQTRALLRQRKPIFEAGVLVKNIYARADVLVPVNDDEWDIIEVKSSAGVKDINLHDASFQKFCYEKAGLNIRKCYLMHINNKYVRNGEIDPYQLFTMADVTGRVLEEGRGIEDRAVEMLEVIAAERCPDVAIGLHCDSFYGCPVESCRDFLPEDDVFQLYRGGRQCYDLLERGIFSLKDIPGDFKLDGRQRIQQQCALTGLPHVNPGEIRKFLGSLEYPLYYLDFETFSPAVPLFDGTRPYQGIPFQFSVHVVEKRKARPRHYSFLAEGRKDPRRELLVALERTLGDSGSIVVYNQSFESGVLSDLGGLFPEYHDRMGNMRGRIIDLLAPFRGFDYYHPLQKGSASIKDVLPALTGTSYEGLGINNGEIASSAFLEITFGDVPDEERRKVRADLEEYCKLDTLGMALIVDKLKELSAAPKKGATS